jgi:hypothetical protein
VVLSDRSGAKGGERSEEATQGRVLEIIGWAVISQNNLSGTFCGRSEKSGGEKRRGEMRKGERREDKRRGEKS